MFIPVMKNISCKYLFMLRSEKNVRTRTLIIISMFITFSIIKRLCHLFLKMIWVFNLFCMLHFFLHLFITLWNVEKNTYWNQHKHFIFLSHIFVILKVIFELYHHWGQYFSLFWSFKNIFIKKIGIPSSRDILSLISITYLSPVTMIVFFNT